MVLAAGLGKRMRPLTETVPKPLIEVGGQTMLDRALDRLEAFGIEEAVVNSHYLGERIESHLAARPSPRIDGKPRRNPCSIPAAAIDERARPAGRCFRSSRSMPTSPGSTVRRPRWSGSPKAGTTAEMDALSADASLRRVPTVTTGRGDYFMDADGALHRRAARDVSPYVFTGIQILHPRLFEDAPEGPFSLNLLYDRAESVERLFGVVHDGEWFHVGTSAALKTADDRLFGRPGAHDFHVG